MSVSTTPGRAVRTALARLIDYAGLFPPAQLDVTHAVAEYAELRERTESWMLGRFIVSAPSLNALTAELARVASAEPFALSYIAVASGDAASFVDGAGAALAQVQAVPAGLVQLEALEVPLPALRAARDSYDASIGQLAALLSKMGLREHPAYVELPRDERFRTELAGAASALARLQLGAKLRCGGTVAAAFPSCDEIAAFIDTMVAAGVPFKCTAGLHHPIRHVDAVTGFHMHGFLNVLAASVFAGTLQRAELGELLAEESPEALTLRGDGLRWRDHVATAEQIEHARQTRFIAYGSCSFDEPVSDLRALSVLA